MYVGVYMCVYVRVCVCVRVYVCDGTYSCKYALAFSMHACVCRCTYACTFLYEINMKPYCLHPERLLKMAGFRALPVGTRPRLGDWLYVVGTEDRTRSDPSYDILWLMDASGACNIVRVKVAYIDAP